MKKLFKDPFFLDVLDLYYETPNFLERSFKKSNTVTNDDDYRIQMAIPGLLKDDLKITIKNSILSVIYENEKDTDLIFTSSFKKTYSLPDDIDETNISAKIENGILEIIIPRDKKKINERVVEIK